MMLCEPCQPRELRGRYCTLRKSIKRSYQFWRSGLCTLHRASRCMRSARMRGIVLSNKVSQYEEVEANQSPSGSWRWLSRLQSQQHRFLEYLGILPHNVPSTTLLLVQKQRLKLHLKKIGGGLNTSCKDWKSFINKVKWSEMIIN